MSVKKREERVWKGGRQKEDDNRGSKSGSTREE